MADTALILGLAGISGTLMSPWIAGRFSNRQQQRALVDERARQERAFEHERTMRDEEELRALLDEVVALVDDCEEAMRAAEGRFLLWGRKIGEEEAGRSAVVRAGEANLRLSRATGRLAVRLGSHHPLRHAAVEAHNGAGRFVGAIGSLAAMGEEADLQHVGDEMTAGKTEFKDARSRFVELATAYAGSRLPRRPELELGFMPGELSARRDQGPRSDAPSGD